MNTPPFRFAKSFGAVWLIVGACAAPDVTEPGKRQPPSTVPRVTAAAFEPARKILLLQVDCMRPDHMSVYGYERSTTPTIDAIAREGVRFTRAYAQANWTKPSVASLFSGLYVRHHGVTVGGTLIAPDGKVMKGLESYPLPPDLPVLAESFQAAGFRTAGFVENTHIVPAQGFDRGFEQYELRFPAALHMRNWLRDENPPGPTFAFVHVIGPHDPYDSSERKGVDFAAYRQRFPDFESEIDFTELDYKKRNDLSDDDVRQAIALYDAELALYDGEQAELLVRWLKKNNLYDDYLIVVTADHGEELYDHQGWAHGHSLFEELTRVPLIIKPPRHMVGVFPPPDSVIEETVEQIDLFPTLLDLAGIAPPAGLDGRSLAPLLLGQREVDPEAFAITEYARNIPEHVVAAAVTQNGRKLVVRYPVPHAPDLHGFADGERFHLFTVEGFDEVERPGAAHAAWARRLRHILEDTLGRSSAITAPQPQGVPLSPEEVDQMKALGYLGD